MTGTGPAQLAGIVLRGRVVAVFFALLAGFSSVLARQSSLGLWRGLVPVGVTVLLVVVYMAMFLRVSRGGPAAFRLTRHGFVAPIPPFRGGGWVIGLGLMVPTTGWGIGPLYATLAAWLLFRPSYLTLTPTGLRVGSLRPTIVPWDSIEPDSPSPDPKSMRVAVDPDLPAQRRIRPPDLPGATPALPAGLDLSVRAILPDRHFVAFAVRYYRATPSAREALGTEIGHELLVAAYRSSMTGIRQ